MDKAAVEKKMEGVISLYRDDIATIRTGRATPALIEDIKVAVYQGRERMKLKQLGAITVSDARTLVFQPWDKSIIKEIKNGILVAGSGLGAVINGEVIRLSLPVLTSEQREEYVRLLGKKTEAARVMIRDIRAEERHHLQEELKGKKISEDQFYQEEKELQEVTDKFINRIDQLEKDKEKEIRGED